MYSVARHCIDQSASLSLRHRRNVAGLCMLCMVNSNSNYCSMSFHLLLPEFDILELRQQLVHSSSKYQDVERFNLKVVSCWPRLVCGMTFPTLYLAPEHWICLKAAVNLWFLSLAVLYSVPWRRCLWGYETIYKQFGFSHLGLCCSF